MGFLDDDFAELPVAEPNLENQFHIDSNVNVQTLDDFLGIEGVVYRDMRLLEDSAHWEDVGGARELRHTAAGFKIVPFPYIGTLPVLPVEGRYEGPRLFDVVWNDLEVVSATPNYEESLQIVEELFPRDAAIVTMCGGGGYSGFMRWLLIHLGWDPENLYNAGAGWRYNGANKLVLVEGEGADMRWRLWRADIARIDFDQLTPLS